MRWLLGTLAVVLLAVVLTFVWWYRSLDGLAERTLERVGSELLGTDVSVGSVDIDLRRGRATVRDVEIANPRGGDLAFSPDPAVRIDEVTVAIQTASLTGTPIVLEEVTVRAPWVNLEVTPTEVNLLVLRRNLDRATAAGADAAAGNQAPRRFLVRRFAFEEGTLRANASAVGRGVRDIKLPKLELLDLGGKSGDTPGGLGKRALEAFLSRVLTQAATDRVSELIDRELDRWKEKGADALRKLLGAGQPQ